LIRIVKGSNRILVTRVQKVNHHLYVK